MFDVDFTEVNPQPLLSELIKDYSVVVYCDGSLTKRGMRVGVVIFRGDERISRISKPILPVNGDKSSVVAEFAALEVAIEWIINKGLTNEKILFLSENTLVIYSMWGDPNNGGRKHRIISGAYVRTARRVEKLLKNLSNCEGRHIPRNENWEADNLSKGIIEYTVGG